MATYAERLARSLEIMNAVQQDGIVRSGRITRTHLERQGDCIIAWLIDIKLSKSHIMPA